MADSRPLMFPASIVTHSLPFSPPGNIPSPHAFRRLTDDERRASMLDYMRHWEKDHDLWVFGYGSLVWRPEFDYVERRLALVRGYHRSLCLWSRINRGTPEQPGLVFGLDNGGSCRGMVYRVAGKHVPDVLDELWKREMSSAAYVPRHLNCHTHQGPVGALVFTMDKTKDGYVRGLQTPQLVDIVRSASGSYGPCIEYVIETNRALKGAGIHDHKLDELVRHLNSAQTPDHNPN